MSTKVFISYSSVDEDFAKKLAQTLEEIGIVYFFDRKDIDWGSSITGEIRKGLSECSAVVVVISPASLKSQWVPFEIGHAMDAGKKILPFLTHPSLDIPGYLHDLHYKTRLEDVKEYFQRLFESPPETREEEVKLKRKVSPKERDKIRAERNKMVMAELKQKEGIRECSVFQLEDHTDKGYLLHVEFDEIKTNAAEVLSTIRATIEKLFPDIAFWGEMKTETDNSVSFAYTYLDEYNKLFR